MEVEQTGFVEIKLDDHVTPCKGIIVNRGADEKLSRMVSMKVCLTLKKLTTILWKYYFIISLHGILMPGYHELRTEDYK